MHCFDVNFSKTFSDIAPSDKNAQLLLVKNLAETPCCFELQSGVIEEKVITLPANWSGLIWFFKVGLRQTAGKGEFYAVDLMRLAKLQAFIDRLFEIKPVRYGKTPFFKVFEIPLIKDVTTFQQIEYWYMRQALSLDEAFQDVVMFVRATEWYQLVVFLIEESHSDELSIEQLGKKYGLSSSYFRQLCKQVLGGSLKGQISDWRLASALIDMIKSQLSVTDIAYRAGYSSLSHFSKEVKKTMGHSTRDLKKIILS